MPVDAANERPRRAGWIPPGPGAPYAAEAEVFGIGRARIVMHLGRPMVGVGTEGYRTAKGHGDPSSAHTEPPGRVHGRQGMAAVPARWHVLCAQPEALDALTG